MATTSLDDIVALFRERGHRRYPGEAVSQLEHALQSAALAAQAQASDPLVVAALLHDVGHLLEERDDSPTLRGVDDRHQFAALPLLRGLFGDAVLQPIRLHVDAKRYLCATRADYCAALSADSQRSLALQGGVFSAAEAARFMARPFAADAVQLRIWDDAAKLADRTTPPLSEFVTWMERIARPAC